MGTMNQKNLPETIILLRVKRLAPILPSWKNLFNIGRGQKEGCSLRYLRNEGISGKERGKC